MIQQQMKRLLLIEEDAATVIEMKQKISLSQTLSVCGEVTSYADVWHTMQTLRPDIVLIGQLRDVQLSMLCQQIRFYFPQTVCAVASSEKESMFDPVLLGLGVWIVSKTHAAEQLEAAVFQWSTPASSCLPRHEDPPISLGATDLKSQQPLKQKHLITVYGPKGGVGKTFLSRELAVFFSTCNQPERPLKVLAVDFNLDLGTFATTLNLTRTPNLYTWVQEIEEQLVQLALRDKKDPVALSHAEWQEYSTLLRLSPRDMEKHIVVHPDSGLHVLTSPRDIRHSFEIKDYHLYVMLETIKQSDYDFILIDTAPDTTDATIQALFFAQRVVMVGNPVVDAIENIQRMLKLLREAEYPEERIQICINRLQRREMFTLEEMKAYFQLHPSKTIFTIPDDDEVKRSINTGAPLMLATGKSVAREAITNIGKSLMPQLFEKEREGSHAGTKQKPSIFSWWKRGGKR